MPTHPAAFLSNTASTACTLAVINQDDPPVVPSAQLLFIDEMAAASASSVSPLSTGVIACSDEDAVGISDDGNGTSPLVYEWATEIFAFGAGGSPADPASLDPLFSLNASTGELLLISPLSYTLAQGAYLYAGFRVRQVFSVNVSVCDLGGACAWGVVAVAVTANYTQPQIPFIFSLTTPLGGLSTDGGSVVSFSGQYFLPGASVAATYCSNATGAFTPTCFTAVGCAAIDAATITCTTTAGWGVGYTWNVTHDNAPLYSLYALVTSFNSPQLDSVVMDTSLPLTAAGVGVTLLGRDLAPASMPAGLLVISYGFSGEFSMTPTSWNTGAITAVLGPGCGAGLPVTVTVAVQPSTSSNPAITVVSFAPPTISLLSLPQGASYSLGALATAGGQGVLVDGSSFGPLSLVMGSAGVQNGVSVLMAGGIGGGAYAFYPTCTKADPTRAHSRLSCTSPPGVSSNFAWTVTVCGQASAPSAQNTSYAPPTLSGLSGPGAVDAATDGGQSVTLSGENVGFADQSGGAAPQSIDAVQYGTPGIWQYTAAGCTVTSASPGLLQCLTVPGVGTNYSWRASIGHQWSNTLYAGSGYGKRSKWGRDRASVHTSFALAGPPVISFFDGPSVYSASTEGGDTVVVDGFNFGTDPSQLSVSYLSLLSIPSDFTGSVPGGGLITYIPPACTITVPHHVLECTLAAGGGRGLTWKPVVAGQVAVSPATSYAAPVVLGLRILAGQGRGSGAPPLANCDGGDEAVLVGSNFGPAALVQRVRYGRTGVEYAVQRWTWLNDSALIATLAPGIGKGNSFTVTTGDQTSSPSVATFDYGDPVVTSVVPGTAVAHFSAGTPVLVTVTGTGFGLLDPSTAVAIGFGNSADSTLVGPLPIMASYPSVSDLRTPNFSWVPGAPQWVQFALPPGLGANRSVRVVPFRAGTAVTMQTILAVPTRGSPADTFSFDAPAVSYVVVLPVSSMLDWATVSSIFPVSNLSEARRIEIYGDSFGPSAWDTGDAVQRLVEFQSTDAYTPALPWSAETVIITNWSATVVIGFTLATSGVVRLRVIAAAPVGDTTVMQVGTVPVYRKKYARGGAYGPSRIAGVGPAELVLRRVSSSRCPRRRILGLPDSRWCHHHLHCDGSG